MTASILAPNPAFIGGHNKPEPIDTTAEAVFLSGPMSGLPGHNRAAFNAEAARLRKAGYLVWNPAELPEGFPWGIYMAVCLAILIMGYGFRRRFDYIAQLPGWDSSRGARIERMIGLELGIFNVPSRELA